MHVSKIGVFLFLAFVVGVTTNIPGVHSQSPDSILTRIPDSPNTDSPQNAKTKIWSPEVLLQNNEYYIMIQDMNPGDKKYSIISNNEKIIQILSQDVFPESTESQMIKIKANDPGEVEIFAINEKNMFNKKIKVVEPALKATKLSLILPSDLLNIKKIPAYVILTDDSDNPVPSQEDLKVDVRAFGNAQVDQNSVTIKKGQHYSSFISRIGGDGGITIATFGLESDTKKISFEIKDDTPVLNIQVAPNPIPPSSSAMVYLWFEKGGKPFVPKEDIKITLTAEDPKFLTFSKDGQFNASPTTKSLSSSTTIYLKAGQSYTKIKVFSTDFISEFNPDFGPDLRHEELKENEAKQYTITAVAEGFEGKQTHIKIQPAKTVKSLASNDRGVLATPTNTKVWAYPNTILDEFDIITAVYTQTTDPANTVATTSDSLVESIGNIESIDADTTEDINDVCSSCAPLVITDADLGIHISAGDLAVAPSRANLYSSSFTSKENYVIVPAKSLGLLGTSKVSAVADGTTGDEFNIKIKQPFTGDLQLGLTPIPIIPNQEQDLFMIYSLRNNVITNDTIKELTVSTNPKIDITNILDVGPIKIVRGIIEPLSQNTQLVSATALATGIESTSSKLMIFDHQKQIQLIYPQQVKPDQPFPLFAYVVDTEKQPISVFYPKDSPAGTIHSLDKGLFKTETGGKISIAVSVDGLTSIATIDSVLKPINLNVLPSRTTINSGETMDLRYVVYPPSSTVSLNTDLRFDEIESGFRVYGTTGEHTLKITAQNDGWETTYQELQIIVNSNDVQTNSTQFNYLKTDNLFVIILISILAIGVFIFAKKKLRFRNKNYEEDLTF